MEATARVLSSFSFPVLPRGRAIACRAGSRRGMGADLPAAARDSSQTEGKGGAREKAVGGEAEMDRMQRRVSTTPDGASPTSSAMTVVGSPCLAATQIGQKASL